MLRSSTHGSLHVRSFLMCPDTTFAPSLVNVPVSVRNPVQFSPEGAIKYTLKEYTYKYRTTVVVAAGDKDILNSLHTTTTTTTTDTTTNLQIPSLILPNGISTPADTLLLGEVISEDSPQASSSHPDATQDMFHITPPSPRHDGIVLDRPTQWEEFADSIVKNHLDKALRRGGGGGAAVSGGAGAGAATATNGAGKDDESNATEQNIEL